MHHVDTMMNTQYEEKTFGREFNTSKIGKILVSFEDKSTNVIDSIFSQ